MKSSERETKAAEATPAEPPVAEPDAQPEGAKSAGRPPDIVCQLWFDQFQHMSTLSTAATAAGLILLQTPYLEATAHSGIAVALFVLAAAVALIGQTKLIDRVHDDKDVGTEVRVYRLLAVMLMGAGTGLFAAMLIH